MIKMYWRNDVMKCLRKSYEAIEHMKDYMKVDNGNDSLGDLLLLICLTFLFAILSFVPVGLSSKCRK